MSILRLILTIVFFFLSGRLSYAIPDGAGNEVFPGRNVGIGTTTPQTALAVTNGNVGIGTWTAAQALDVKGNITATGTISGAAISGAINPSTLEVTGQTALNTSSGNTGIGTTLTGGNTARLAVIGGNVGIGTITPQGALVVTNGNVGIGTWAPSNKMEIVANALGITQVDGRGFKLINNTAAVDGVQQVSPAIIWRGYGYRPIPQDDSVSLDFRMYVAPVQSSSLNEGYLSFESQADGGGYLNKLTLTHSGNLGIGSISPVQKLDVNGNVSSTGFLTTGGYTQSGSSGNTITGVTTFSNVTNSALFTGGNVGIGSTAPGQKLDVQGTVRTTGFTLNLSPNAGYVLQTNSVGVGTWVAPSTIISAGGSPSGGQNAVQYNDSSAFTGSEAVFSFNGTNVGIGTTNGVQVLDVRTTASMAMNVGIGTTATGIAARLAVIGGNVGIGTITPQGGFVVTNGNVGIGTWTADYARMVVRGNVGIGTSSATNADLNVYGNVGIGTPASFNNLKIANLITTNSEYDNGSQGAGYTVDWNKGNKQKLTYSSNITVGFTAPTIGVGNLMLKLVNSGGAGDPTISSAKWIGQATPDFTNTNGAVDIITCYYDGSSYYCTAGLNFTP